MFFLAHIFCICPWKHYAVTRRSRRALQRRVCRTPGRALCSRSLMHLAQASCRHRIFLFGFVFPVVTQKVRRALAQPVAMSATLCIFAHAPLLPTNFHICCPPAGLGVRLFTGSGAGLRRPLMCCLTLQICQLASTKSKTTSPSFHICASYAQSDPKMTQK